MQSRANRIEELVAPGLCVAPKEDKLIEVPALPFPGENSITAPEGSISKQDS